MVTTTVKKWGNSNAIRLPSATLNRLNINENDELQIVTRDNEIVLIPKKQINSIDELFENYTSDYFGVPELDWGDHAGTEVW